MAPSLIYRRLRAPRNDGELLLEPNGPECLLLPAKNRALLATHDFDLDGESIQSLRTTARHELLAGARNYTADYAAELPSVSDHQLILMSGHQPTLFHPGVWAKNFAINRLAREVRGVAIHVIIDNDAMRENSIRIPTGSLTSPEMGTEPFDTFSEPIPFECRKTQDLSLLESFPARVHNRIKPFVDKPLVGLIWNDVMSAVRDGKPLGHSFAQARHLLEQSWGLQTLEIPLSQVCDSNAFLRFAVHLLIRGEEVLNAYNRRLAEYRSAHRLRNQAQPLPDLRRDGEWHEAPFWIWTSDDFRRRALWWRRDGEDLRLGDRNANCWTLSTPAHDPIAAIKKLSTLCKANLQIRPRALTNTMYLRLVLCDCFVHGIGGAKYDQITDLLIHDLFGILPPDPVVLSQTSLLPVAAKRTTGAELAKNKQILRSMYFHPENFLDAKMRSDAKVSSLEEMKRKMPAFIK